MKITEQQQKRRTGILRAFWPYARPYGGKIGLALAILLLDTLTSLAAPWAIKLIYDNVLLGKHLHQPWSLIIPQAVAQNRLLLFAILCGAMLVFALVGAAATYTGTQMLAVTGQRVIFRLRCTLFAHLQELSPAFYDRQRLGDLLTRLTSDVQSIQDMLVILLFINPIFGLVGMVIAVCVYVVLRWYLVNIKKMARQTRRQEGDANAVAQENLLGIRVVQAFGMEAHAKQRYEDSVARVLQFGEKAAKLQSGLPSVLTLMTDLGTLLVLGGGGLLVLQGWISIGDLLVLSAYLRIMYSPLRQLGDVAHTAADTSAARTDLGFAPVYTLMDGLQLEANWLAELLVEPVGQLV